MSVHCPASHAPGSYVIGAGAKGGSSNGGTRKKEGLGGIAAGLCFDGSIGVFGVKEGKGVVG